MSKIFIAWSGNKELAQAVAKYINENSRGSECVVGGDYSDSNDVFLGPTVLKEMNRCHRAIMLVQKHPRTGIISPNLMFEWGYLLAQLGGLKVHNYFIDIGENDEIIPNDVKGVYADFVTYASKTDEQLAEEIGKGFLQKSQHHVVTGNKMASIMEWYKIKDFIRRHSDNPICSDYEMAQYLVNYIYSAHIFSNIIDDVYDDLEQLGKNYKTNSPEFKVSLKGARTTISLLKAIRNEESDQTITIDDFYKIEKTFINVLEQIAALDDSIVKVLLEAIYGNVIAFAYLLILYNDGVPAELKKAYADKLIKVSERVVVLCNRLEEDSPDDNKQLCELLRAYMYRGMFCAFDICKKLETAGQLPPCENPEEREAKIRENLINSFNERKLLYQDYEGENINGVFFENVEMEYYLAMAELYTYEEDVITRFEMKHQLEFYVSASEKTTGDKMVFVKKIGGYIR